MVKKLFKSILRILVGIIILASTAYGLFHLVEYASGGKYVNYLTNNSETLPLDADFSFKMLDQDIIKNKIILSGEIHGFYEPQQFDVSLFKHLHKNHGVRNYYCEFDLVHAYYLNDFMATGNQELLKLALTDWAVIQGQNNRSYYNKYIELQEFYTSLPNTDKFKFYGVDKLINTKGLNDFIKRFDKQGQYLNTEFAYEQAIITALENIIDSNAFTGDTLFTLKNLKQNILFHQTNKNREDVMFENFVAVFNNYNHYNEISYGYFGMYHVFQYKVNGKNPLAAKLRVSDLNLENNILSINFLMNDSKMVMPSNALPEFMREPGQYSRLPVSADNMLFMYMYGIKDLKRITPEHHKSLIKMNGKSSPYANTNRMKKAFQLLPVTDLLEMNEPNKPYVQYSLFIRNSDWAEPFD